jgi:hypothetical protein
MFLIYAYSVYFVKEEICFVNAVMHFSEWFLKEYEYTGKYIYIFKNTEMKMCRTKILSSLRMCGCGASSCIKGRK